MCGCRCGESGQYLVSPQVFAAPTDPDTYRAVLDAWWDKLRSGRPQPENIREGFVHLARFHATLQSSDFASRLSVADRSLNKLELAYDTIGRSP